ncbi:Spindolin-related protein [Pseudoalteromonas luteoviolacea B = ATCC 29581]|nr:Spindolin-related protein [Pseudoalteromonas luteoviolacea B = ATCC 29581]
MKQHVKVSLIALATWVAIPSFNAVAHGYMDFPKARQAICEAQGGYWWPEDGSNIPNAACRAAFLESGYVQFTQEHEFSVNTANYLNQTAVEANIPNGTLCAAGSHQKRGIDLPSKDWQKTTLVTNAKGEVALRWLATTPHNPSFWKIYLSKPGFDTATQKLTWQDLEPIAEFGNLEFTKDNDGKRYYHMTVMIPAGRQGDAILYSRWQRNDVVGEGFYNCSDVHIESDPTPPLWVSAGYFVSASDKPNIGDIALARVFDGNGQEIVSQSLTLTQDNSAYWQSKLASMLNQQFREAINVGVLGESGEIVFDSANVLRNQVYVAKADHTYNLTIKPAAINTPPIIRQPEPITLNENTSLSLHVHAFDDEQSQLTYRYQTNSPLTISGNGATVTLSASEVEKDTQSTIVVTVSDGLLDTQASISVTVKNLVSTNPAWQASKVYWGGDKVSYKGKNYQAKWWTRGEQPDKAQVWKEI